jgi:hypothetical protein
MVDFIHLIAAIGGLEAVIHNNQAKIGAKITIQEEMKALVGSLASRIITNQEEMKEEIKFGQVEMKAPVSAILQK